MDRYPYILYTLLLRQAYTWANRCLLHIFIAYIIHNHTRRLSSFWRRCRGSNKSLVLRKKLINGPFQVLERINDNAFKIDLLGEYNICATFNVYDLSI